MRKLCPFRRDTLEAIVNAKFARTIELDDLSGWSRASVMRAVSDLQKLGLIVRGAGFWSPTESGKIVMAIILGKEVKARKPAA